MKAFGMVPRFVGKRLSGKKAFIAFGLTAGKKPAALAPRPGLLVASKAQKRRLRKGSVSGGF